MAHGRQVSLSIGTAVPAGPDTSSTEHCIAADPSQIDQHRLWRWHFFAASSRGRRCARKSECAREIAQVFGKVVEAAEKPVP
jgi:hypothetical protein